MQVESPFLEVVQPEAQKLLTSQSSTGNHVMTAMSTACPYGNRDPCSSGESGMHVPFVRRQAICISKGIWFMTQNFVSPSWNWSFADLFWGFRQLLSTVSKHKKASFWKPNPAVSTKPPPPDRSSYHETQTAMGSSGCTSSLTKMPIEVSNILNVTFETDVCFLPNSR